MSIQFKGNGGTVAEVDPNFRALHVTRRPIDVGVLGSYRKALVSGTIAAALGADSIVYAFRYGGANLCIPRRILISAGDLVGFTAGFVVFNLFPARAFSASDTGGTAATLTGNNSKLRTSMATTGVSDIQIANTGAMSAGTRTLDADPMDTIAASVVATAGQRILDKSELFSARDDEWPLVLAQNEGFEIHATVPATGTWKLGVTTIWDEVTTASWPQGT